MSNTKIKSSQFHGVVGHGTDGYFLITNGDGSMSWIANIVNPVISSLSYPGSATAADLAGGETITITGTGFKTGATVTVGGTAAPSVSYVSATSLTITTPAKAAGDYDVVVTNTDGGTATSVNGISFNGIPSWTTAAGTLGTFASDTTISTITLQASEPDSGTITFSITNGALPTGLSLTGADIDGTTTLETADTLYTFTVTATDDETQTTPRTFTITVTKQFINTDNFTINTYTGNGSTQSIEGKIGTAASFNGSSSYITASGLGVTGNSAFSTSTWVKTTSTGLFFFFGNGTLNSSFYISVETGGAYSGNVRVGNFGTDLFTSSASVNDGNWHHVAFTSDGTTSKLYINGSESNSTSHTWAISADIIELGRGTSSYYFNGSLDQVRVFNKALSSSEITTLYGESNTSTTKSTTDIFDDGSGVALYEFEEGAKDTGGVSGYIGSGGIFNGNGNITTSLDFNSFTDYSISMWVYADVNAGFIAGTINSSGTTGLYLQIDTSGNVIFYEVSSGGTAYTVTSTGTITTNDWNHIVLVRDSSTNYVYINNGSPDSASNASITHATGLTLGRGGAFTAAGIYTGKLDQVRIFDKALSSSEVTTLYGETSASATKSTTDIFSDGSGIALYELEGNANDSGRFGRGAIDSGQSAVFNNSTSLIDTGISSLSTNFSFSCYIKENSLASGSIFGNWNATSANDIYLDTNSSGQLIVAFDGISNQVFGTSGDIKPNNWHHIAFTFNNGTVIAYLDGNSLGTSTTGNTSFSSGLNFCIGASSTKSNSSHFNGSIDQVRIYSSTLAASDIEALVSETNVPTANLIAHYKLDGNANDETTNYNGTASNITYSDPAEFPTYDGTATNVSYAYDGTPTNVNFLGTSFQPDLVWVKVRDASTSHALIDSVRGRSSARTFFCSRNDNI